MTFGERGQYRRSSLRRKSKLSCIQKENMHIPVEGQHAAIKDRHNIVDENNEKLQIRCTPNNIEQRHLGESNHLLILADSAELLMASENDFHNSEMNNYGYEGQRGMEIAMQGNADAEAEENGVHMQEKVRLTQIRRLARLKNHKSKEERHERCKTGCTNKCSKAQGRFQQITPKRKQVCLPEPREVNNEGLHQAAVEKHMIANHLVLMNNEPGELREQEEVAHQLTLLKTETRSYLSENQCPTVAPHEQVHVPLNERIGQSGMPVTKPQMVLMSEMPQDNRSMARQRRMLRIYERRQQRSLAQMKQMYEAERKWLWDTMNFQNRHVPAANQQCPFYMSNMPWQQHYFAAQLRRASQTTHNHLYSHQLREYSEEGITNQDGGARAEASKNQSSEQVREQATINVEARGTISHVKLNKIKREARMKHSHPIDKKHELQLDHQTDAGNKSNKAKGIMLQT